METNRITEIFLVLFASIGFWSSGLLRRVRTVNRLGSVKRITTTSGVLIVLFMFFIAKYSRYDGIKMVKEKTDLTKTLSEADGPNTTWLQLRQRLRGKNGSSPSKVLLFGYMRGGSSLFSEIFNLDPMSSVMWHEPLDAFYQSHGAMEPFSIPLSLLYFDNRTRRLLSEYEQNELTNYLENLLFCRPENLPFETFAHFYVYYSSAFRNIHDCMEQKKAKSFINECTKPLRFMTGYQDLIRRNMSVWVENKIEHIITALKSHLPRNQHRFMFTQENGKTQSGAFDVSSKLVQCVHQYQQIIDDVRRRVSNASTEHVRFLFNYSFCLAQTEASGLKECIRPAFESCHRAKLIAAKVIRMMLDSLEDLIQRIPDIQVIYYVRDPRATATSRSNHTVQLTMSSKDKSALYESKILCARMREDLRARKRLERKYPGSIITIRYEDFVRHPAETAKEVFDGLGLRVQSDVLTKWISSRFNGTNDNGVYGTVRVDPVTTSVDWMKKTNLKEALEMERYCQDVLRELGYMNLLSKTPNDFYYSEQLDRTPL